MITHYLTRAMARVDRMREPWRTIVLDTWQVSLVAVIILAAMYVFGTLSEPNIPMGAV